MKINRRQLISYIGFSISSIALHGCNKGSANKNNIAPINVSNISELRCLRANFSDGQLINVAGHTIPGIGGGLFQVDLTDYHVIDDDGSTIIGIYGIKFKRINVTQPTPEMFGAGINPQDDQSIFINKCANVYGRCYLQGEQTYNIQHPVTATELNTCDAGYATLNLLSPFGDNRFGLSPYPDSAAVYCNGEIGKPLYGVNIENIVVRCNGLVNSNGTVGVKGFLFMRCHGFYQRNCFVYDSASYAFWDADADFLPLPLMTYCSGIRENCCAIDSQISFEQVNCRGVTLNNCHAYRSHRELSYSVEALFHCYGGSDMQLVYQNCSGFADGQCATTLFVARECKNVLISNCQFINNFNNGNNLQCGVYFEWGNSDYGDIQFINCTIISKHSTSLILCIGQRGSNSSELGFTSCIIKGHQVGVQINGNSGIFKFINCDVEARASDEIVPWAYYSNGNPSTVEIKGGKASALGDIVIAVSNMNSDIFEDVILTPPLN